MSRVLYLKAWIAGYDQSSISTIMLCIYLIFRFSYLIPVYAYPFGFPDFPYILKRSQLLIEYIRLTKVSISTIPYLYTSIITFKDSKARYPALLLTTHHCDVRCNTTSLMFISSKQSRNYI